MCWLNLRVFALRTIEETRKTAMAGQRCLLCNVRIPLRDARTGAGEKTTLCNGFGYFANFDRRYRAETAWADNNFSS